MIIFESLNGFRDPQKHLLRYVCSVRRLHVFTTTKVVNQRTVNINKLVPRRCIRMVSQAKNQTWLCCGINFAIQAELPLESEKLARVFVEIASITQISWQENEF
jgi:hypothetical protein